MFELFAQEEEALRKFKEQRATGQRQGNAVYHSLLVENTGDLIPQRVSWPACLVRVAWHWHGKAQPVLGKATPPLGKV